MIFQKKLYKIIHLSYLLSLHYNMSHFYKNPTPAYGATRVWRIFYCSPKLSGAFCCGTYDDEKSAKTVLENVATNPKSYLQTYWKEISENNEISIDDFSISESLSSVLK